jgi:hypothetical protein
VKTLEIVGLSPEAATALIDEFGELPAQKHPMYCLWMMEQGNAHAAGVVDRITQSQLAAHTRYATRLDAASDDISDRRANFRPVRQAAARRARRCRNPLTSSPHR